MSLTAYEHLYADMIPTAIIFGLVIGRLWAIPLAAVLWLALLAGDDSCLPGCAPGAAGLAAVNALVGVAVHRAVRLALTPDVRQG